MLFHSATFLVAFLVPVLVAFYAAARWAGARWAIGILVVASLAFYGWSRPAHLAVLLGSIVCNYALAAGVIAHRGTGRGQLWLTLGVLLNIGVLAWFKYAAFLGATVATLTGWQLGFHAVVLPLGVSFFTFQKIAYLVDAWRGQFTTQRWSDYALFVTFFPQLVAGPIVHQREFFPQLEGPEFARWRTERFVGGAAIFVLGVGKKLLLADPLGADADALFARLAAAQPVGGLDGWLGVLSYTFQIYFDFSAYTDMAIGLALLFGITLPENFAAPYRATSIIEFWRRWHMTLSRFLREYVYVPLGGNAGGPWRQTRSLFVTMLIGGLWHGAAWTFVAWGAVHGVLLALNHGWRRLGFRLPNIAGWVLTFGAVSLAWIWFRAGSFAVAQRGFAAIAGADGFWPGGAADAAAWLRTVRPTSGGAELANLFSFLGWTGPIGRSGAEWHNVLFGGLVLQGGRLILAFSVVLFATPVVRWIWDLTAGRARFTAGKAVTVAAVLVAVILAGISATPSTFIYFRF